MNQEWYLGLDIGTSHLGAVLVNRDRQRQYPLYWEQGDGRTFALPMLVCATDQPTQPWQMATGLVAGQSLEGWKPFLRLAPFYGDRQGGWYPTLPWGNKQELPLKSVIDALTFLLQVVRDRSQSEELAPLKVRDILINLQGVIVSVPSQWDDTYRLNIREALQRAALVQHGSAVVFVPEAIATLLGFQAQLPHTEGETLVIHSGESHTDLAVVDLPAYFPQLQATQIHSHSFDYGGIALRQDILCQLIYPQWLPHLTDTLGILAKTMPQAGAIDLEYRLLAAWQWRNSAIGRSLLQAAHQTKQLLQKREKFAAHLGDQPWQVSRLELDKKVIYPFQQQLNRQINHLFAVAGVTAQGIQQIVCSGSNLDYCWSFLAPWLHQKFPQAELIRDPVPPSVGRVAVGLGLVPLIPEIVNGDQHRYHDYLLLGTILDIAPGNPFELDTLHRLLQGQGINTRGCGDRLQGLLLSQRPAGLAPDVDEHQGNVFCQYPLANSPAPALCWLDAQGLYHVHEAQREHLQHHLQVLSQGYNAELLEPYILPFGRSPLQIPPQT